MRATGVGRYRHKPWTLSSDGKGRITIVLGREPEHLPTSVEDMTDYFNGADGCFSLPKFLRSLADHDGDLVSLAASGMLGQAIFKEAFELLGKNHESHGEK